MPEFGLLRNKFLRGLGIACLVWLPFYPMLMGYFSDDDFNAIYLIKNFALTDLLDPITNPTTTYRPVSFTAIFIIFRLVGPDALGFHLVPLLLHTINVLLAYALIRALGQERSAALLGALLFGIFRFHNFTLYVTTNFGEVLVLSFLLLALLSLLRFSRSGQWRYALAFIVAGVLAMGTKENGLVLPIAAALVLVWQHRPVEMTDRSEWRSSLSNATRQRWPLALVGLSFVMALAFGGLLLQTEKLYALGGLDNYRLESRIFVHLAENLMRMASFNWIELDSGLMVLTVLLLGALAAGLAFRQIGFWALWTLLFMLPYLPFAANFHRAMYIPSLGFFTAAGLLMLSSMVKMGLSAQRQTIVLSVLLVSVLIFSTLGSHQDIAGFNQKSWQLEIFTREVADLSPAIPADSLIVLQNPPSEPWITAGAIRLITNNRDVQVLAWDPQFSPSEIHQRLSQVDQNLLGFEPQQIIFLAFEAEQLTELARIPLD
jgi:hypothetical protein